MTVSTLRPNGTTLNSGVGVTGASAHAALSDNSDASYLTFDSIADWVLLALGDISITAGAVVKSIAIRIRGRHSTTSGLNTVRVQVSNGLDLLAIGVAAGTLKGDITTFTMTAESGVVSPGGISDAMLDAAVVTIALTGFGSGGDIRLHELYVDVTYVEKPEVTSVEPNGTIEDTNRPTVVWTTFGGLDSDGGPQTHYEVAVVANGDDPDVDPIIVGSGVLAGAATSWQLDEPLPDGAYHCCVRVAQTVNGAQFWSNWGQENFAIDVLLPGEPTIGLVPEPDSGRMRVDLEHDAGGDATTDLFEVQASDDAGLTWRTIRTVLGRGMVAPDGGSATVWDHEGANGVDVTYRARALHDYSGLYAVSAWSEETGMWGPTRARWLKHPTDPSLNLAVDVYSYADRKRDARQGVFQPLGRDDAIVVSDTRQASTGTVVLMASTTEDQDALDALLDSRAPLLLQVAAADMRPDRWLVFGPHSSNAVVDKLAAEPTLDTLGWTEVLRP